MPFLLLGPSISRTADRLGLVINRLDLVVQDKGIIADTALYQRTRDTGRIFVDGVVLQLHRGYGGAGVGCYEANPAGRRQGKEWPHRLPRKE